MPPKGSKKKTPAKGKGKIEDESVEAGSIPAATVADNAVEEKETPIESKEDPQKSEEVEKVSSPNESTDIIKETIVAESSDIIQETPKEAEVVPEANNINNPKTTTSISDMKDRLFQLRLKINQGRQANKAEVEEEFKRFSDKKRARRDEDDDDQGGNRGKQKSNKSQEINMNQTAEEAEWVAEKNRKKQEAAATFGLNSFTEDANFRSYEKRVNKLGSSSSNTESSKPTRTLADNPFDYGISNTSVSASGLDKLSKEIHDIEEKRHKTNSRKMHVDGDVDYINDKNAKFNKKLDRAFDKYTVEIRQNLERGTAI